MSEAATTAEKMLTPIVTGAVVGLGTVISQWLNHRRGKKKDAAGSNVLSRIEKKIDDNHVENRETCRLLALRIDGVEGVADDALSQCIGPAPDRKNGLKSRMDDLEKWQESVTKRERDELERLRIERQGIGPGSVGSFMPRTV